MLKQNYGKLKICTIKSKTTTKMTKQKAEKEEIGKQTTEETNKKIIVKF